VESVRGFLRRRDESVQQRGWAKRYGEEKMKGGRKYTAIL